MGPSSRIQIEAGVVTFLLGVAVTWMFPATPGKIVGLVLFILSLSWGLWLLFRFLDELAPSFVYIKPLPFGGLGPDGFRHCRVMHHGPRPIFDVQLTLIDQCDAHYMPGPEYYFEFREIGRTLLFGAERQVQWRPLSPGYDVFLIHMSVRGFDLLQQLWIHGQEYRLTVRRLNPGGSETPLYAAHSRKYVPADPPCGPSAPPMPPPRRVES